MNESKQERAERLEADRARRAALHRGGVATVTLTEFLAARLAEDEMWALAASAPYQHAEGNPAVPPGGLHWRWGAGENWEPVTLDPSVSEFVAEPGHGCVLITRETWPSQSGPWDMPRSYATEIVEMDTAAAGHIARHDPARVLREVEAGRGLLVAYRESIDGIDADFGVADALEAEISRRCAVWSDHPDYDEAWRP